MAARGLGLPLGYSKRYSKAFNPTTVVRNGYLEYRRRDNLRLFTIRLPGLIGAMFKMDNR